VGIGKLNPEDVTDAIGFVKSMLKYNDKGEAFVAYKDGAGKEIEQPLGEYVEKVYPTTSHAKRFIPAAGNSGTGGGDKGKSKAFATGNPFAKDSFNLTRQMDLLRENRPEAVRLATEAGVAIS
jgi:hypothetical protein